VVVNSPSGAKRGQFASAIPFVDALPPLNAPMRFICHVRIRCRIFTAGSHRQHLNPWIREMTGLITINEYLRWRKMSLFGDIAHVDDEVQPIESCGGSPDNWTLRANSRRRLKTITRPARAVLAKKNFFLGGEGLAPSASRGAEAAREKWGLGSPQKIFWIKEPNIMCRLMQTTQKVTTDSWFTELCKF